MQRFPEPDPVQPPESELVEDCKSGSLSAFERLYQVHGPRMKSIAFNLLGNVSDAEDAVQEAFLKIYRSLKDFRGESTFSTWIYRILVNTCYDLRRRRKRRPEASSLDAEQGPLLFADPSDHPLRLTLEKSLRQLSPRSRSVFLLYEVEGFKHREIAEILEIREGTSKALLFEARRELQRLVMENPTNR